ncbi:hypothetical protein F5877DRAFT_72339 [Lentinula edodes]|nr:hypothetical protein F5877DRAFT_72339 [Lentinula edodes]
MVKDLSPAGDDQTNASGAADMEIDAPGAGPSIGRDFTPPKDVHPPMHLPPSPHTPSIFTGLRFTALGEGNCDSICSAIRKAGGTFVKNVDPKAEAYEADIIIVRLLLPAGFPHGFRDPHHLEVHTVGCGGGLRSGISEAGFELGEGSGLCLAGGDEETLGGREGR